jgi:hypothetical protein
MDEFGPHSTPAQRSGEAKRIQYLCKRQPRIESLKEPDSDSIPLLKFRSVQS